MVSLLSRARTNRMDGRTDGRTEGREGGKYHPSIHPSPTDRPTDRFIHSFCVHPPVRGNLLSTACFLSFFYYLCRTCRSLLTKLELLLRLLHSLQQPIVVIHHQRALRCCWWCFRLGVQHRHINNIKRAAHTPGSPPSDLCLARWGPPARTLCRCGSQPTKRRKAHTHTAHTHSTHTTQHTQHTAHHAAHTSHSTSHSTQRTH